MNNNDDVDNVDDGDYLDFDEEGDIEFEQEFWQLAVESGNVQQLKDLVEEHGLLEVFTRNFERDRVEVSNALIVAIRENQMDMVKYLLEHCRSVVSIDDIIWTHNNDALRFVAGNGNVEMFQYLIHQGMEADLSWALYVAAEFEQYDLFRFLVETPECDIDAAAGAHRDTVLHIAIAKGNLKMVQCLMEHYKTVNLERYTRESQLALHKTCAMSGTGSLAIATYLLETCCVDVEALLDDEDDQLYHNPKCTPLLHACRYGHLDFIRYLVERCGANINAKDNNGNTVLHAAVQRLEVVRYFVEGHGVNVEQPNNKGETVLSVACEIPFYSKTVRYLVEECNANVNATDLNGATCLHSASRSFCMSAAQCVLESGRVANINAQDRNGQTPLHHSCTRYGYEYGFGVTRFCVDVAGANFAIPDKDGKTALHIAAEATVASRAARDQTAAQQSFRTVFFLVTRIAIDNDDVCCQ